MFALALVCACFLEQTSHTPSLSRKLPLLDHLPKGTGPPSPALQLATPLPCLAGARQSGGGAEKETGSVPVLCSSPASARVSLAGGCACTRLVVADVVDEGAESNRLDEEHADGGEKRDEQHNLSAREGGVRFWCVRGVCFGEDGRRERIQ